MQPLRVLSETECYLRLYGDREETVRIVRRESRQPLGLPEVAPEHGWEGLESREDEAA